MKEMTDAEYEESKKLKLTKLKKPYLQKDKKILGLIKTGKTELLTGERLKELEPLMLYITEEGKIQTYTNVTPGYIVPKDERGREKDYKNHIEAKKLLQWEYDGQDIRTYVQYEKERHCYPLEPMIDARTISLAVKNIHENQKDYEEKGSLFGKLSKEKVRNILVLVGGLIGIVIGGLYFANMFDIISLGATSGGTQTVTSVAQNLAQNASANGVVIIP